jgi:phosphoglycolate phosphatase-like HAD superfamily hydrolase
MTYNAVMFDLDGTIIHTTTEYRHFVVSNTLRNIKGLPESVQPASTQDMDLFWFESERDRIIADRFHVNPGCFWKVYGRWDTVEARRRSVSPYRDIAFIGELRTNGFKVGIVTGAPKDIIELEMKILYDLLGTDAFQAVVRAQPDSGVRTKPDPEGIVKCLEFMRVCREDAIYVGNGREDVDAAKNAGVLDVLVLRGEYEFEGLDASVKISDLYGLRDVLGL